MGRGDLAALVVTNDMPKDPNGYVKDKQIADALNLNATVIKSIFVNEASFIDQIGVSTADTILNKLDAMSLVNSGLKRAMKWFYVDRGLDFGDSQFREVIDSLTDDLDPTKLTNDQATLIKSLAEFPRDVTPEQVSIALRGNAQFTPV